MLSCGKLANGSPTPKHLKSIGLSELLQQLCVTESQQVFLSVLIDRGGGTVEVTATFGDRKLVLSSDG